MTLTQQCSRRNKYSRNLSKNLPTQAGSYLKQQRLFSDVFKHKKRRECHSKTSEPADNKNLLRT